MIGFLFPCLLKQLDKVESKDQKEDCYRFGEEREFKEIAQRC